MATPSSPIGFSDIYSEANGAAPGSATSLRALATSSYFIGPNGSNTIAYNGWGQAKGDDGIYSVQALSATPVSFNDYRNVSYFYDQSQYQVSFEVQNNNGTYGFDVIMDYMDTSLNYSYLFTNTGGGLLSPSTTYGPTEASLSTTPLIYGCNWRLTINPDSGYTSPTATIRLDINGSTLFSGININPVGTPTIEDYITHGNAYMTIDQPVSGATGSLINIRIS
jgi:hypothetical protein